MTNRLLQLPRLLGAAQVGAVGAAVTSGVGAMMAESLGVSLALTALCACELAAAEVIGRARRFAVQLARSIQP